VLVCLPLRIEKPTTVAVKSTPDNAQGVHAAGIVSGTHGRNVR
jgi:hypothetical protein